MKRLLMFLTIALLFVVVAVAVHAAGPYSIQVPDSEGNVGLSTFLVLDSAGNPLVSYFDSFPNRDLKLMHCNDPRCAGGDESIVSLATEAWSGEYNALALDANGNPVIAFSADAELRVMHCNDPNCAGDDESVAVPDDSTFGAWHIFMRLDANGYPVVSYYDQYNDELVLLHCNDPNCAGEDDNVSRPDAGGGHGKFNSLALDSAGNPVISYSASFGSSRLRLMHCNDPNCDGGNESISTPEPMGIEIGATSLVLDEAGNPVVAYTASVNSDLKLLRCNDPNCTGGDESITLPDESAEAGNTTRALALDAAGRPIIAYVADGYGGDKNLRLVRCNDLYCAGGDEEVEILDDMFNVGFGNSLKLDRHGLVVISYYDWRDQDLRLLRELHINALPVVMRSQ